MSASPDSAEALLGRLEWTVIRRLDGLLQGDYKTLFRGFGIDLADLREYQPHDDVRRIEWNVTARTGVPHVRVYNEDRELTAWFLLDLSPSVDFGSGDVSKRQVLAEFTAVLARLLTRQGNKVGAILTDGINRLVVPPRGGRAQVLYLLDKVRTHPRLLRAPRTDLGTFLGSAIGALKRRSLVFAISDYVSNPGWEKQLAMLGRRHEVLAVRLTDPIDLALPDLGLMPMEDAETGEQIFVDTGDRGFLRRFTEIGEAHEASMMSAFEAAGADVLELSTGDDLIDAIRRFADLRRGTGASPPANLAGAPNREAAP